MPVAWRYPAVELATAALFLLCYLRYGLTVDGVGMAVLCFLLLGLAVMDSETMRLPDVFTFPGIALGVLYSGISLGIFKEIPPALNLPWGIGVFSPEQHSSASSLWPLLLAGLVASAIWAILAALLLLLIRWLYYLVRHQEGLGMGDVKLLAMIAAWLGPMPTILTLLLGALAAGLFGILAVAFSRGKHPFLTTRLPLGSFLCAAAIYVIFAGNPIIAWYLRFYGIGN